jgi:hypothetical protein
MTTKLLSVENFGKPTCRKYVKSKATAVTDSGGPQACFLGRTNTSYIHNIKAISVTDSVVPQVCFL